MKIIDRFFYGPWGKDGRAWPKEGAFFSYGCRSGAWNDVTLLVTIRNPWMLYVFGWRSPPDHVTANWRLWLTWLWCGPDLEAVYWPPRVRA